MSMHTVVIVIIAAFVIACGISALIEWKACKIAKLADQEMMRRHVSREDPGRLKR